MVLSGGQKWFRPFLRDKSYWKKFFTSNQLNFVRSYSQITTEILKLCEPIIVWIDRVSTIEMVVLSLISCNVKVKTKHYESWYAHLHMLSCLTVNINRAQWTFYRVWYRQVAVWLTVGKGSILVVRARRLQKSNQIFHYIRCNTQKRVTSLRGPSPRHCAGATQLLSKKCLSDGEPLATMCTIWRAQDLNL